MDSILILNQALSLLYLESKLEQGKNRSIDVIKRVLKLVKVPRKVSDLDQERDIVVGFKNTASWLVNEIERGNDVSFKVLMQRLIVNSGFDDDEQKYIDAFKGYELITQDEILKACIDIRSQIFDYIKYIEFSKVLEDLNKDLLYMDTKTDWKKQITHKIEELNGLVTVETSGVQAYIIDSLQFDDVDSIASVLGDALADVHGDTGLKSNITYLNDMLGESQRFRLGMFVLIGALTHCYKSGLAGDLFLSFCTENTPVPEDKLPPGIRKQAILNLSLENRAQEDIAKYYTALKERETGEAVNMNTIDIKDASKYMYTKLSATGFLPIYMRVNPSIFGQRELFELIESYEAEGIQIVAVVMDYLGLCKKEKSTGPNGEDIRKLVQDVRVFMSSKNILFITPHQLSQEAMSLKRMGVDNFLTTIAGKNYWDASKRISNEVDLELYLDRVKFNKKWYLHIHRGKHRTIRPTPSIYLEFYQPFGDVGYLLPDTHLDTPLGIRDLKVSTSDSFNLNDIVL